MVVVAQRKSLPLLGIKPHCPGHSLVTLLNDIPYQHCLYVINSWNSNLTAASLTINIAHHTDGPQPNIYFIMGATIKSWTLYHKNTIMFDNYIIQKSDF